MLSAVEFTFEGHNIQNWDELEEALNEAR